VNRGGVNGRTTITAVGDSGGPGSGSCVYSGSVEVIPLSCPSTDSRICLGVRQRDEIGELTGAMCFSGIVSGMLTSSAIAFRWTSRKLSMLSTEDVRLS